MIQQTLQSDLDKAVLKLHANTFSKLLNTSAHPHHLLPLISLQIIEALKQSSPPYTVRTYTLHSLQDNTCLGTIHTWSRHQPQQMPS